MQTFHIFPTINLIPSKVHPIIHLGRRVGRFRDGQGWLGRLLHRRRLDAGTRKGLKLRLLTPVHAGGGRGTTRNVGGGGSGGGAGHLKDETGATVFARWRRRLGRETQLQSAGAIGGQGHLGSGRVLGSGVVVGRDRREDRHHDALASSTHESPWTLHGKVLLFKKNRKDNQEWFQMRFQKLKI